jgi:hypothetical protein
MKSPTTDICKAANLPQKHRQLLIILSKTALFASILFNAEPDSGITAG